MARRGLASNPRHDSASCNGFTNAMPAWLNGAPLRPRSRQRPVSHTAIGATDVKTKTAHTLDRIDPHSLARTFGIPKMDGRTVLAHIKESEKPEDDSHGHPDNLGRRSG
jgi:hypothetical protein